MRTSLGISAGNEVVCSALVATASNGAQSFDYRVVSADAAHSDLGDLVASSIDLMTTQLPTQQVPHDIAWPTQPVGVRLAGATGMEAAAGKPPTSVAVAYRGKEQEQVIRSATGKQRELKLVPEGTAALTFLRHTGLLDRYETVAIVDLGATGLSVTVADQADGNILRSERIHAISGNAIDDLIYHHLLDVHYARRGTRPNRGMLTNRGRAAKEHLSVAPAVTIDHVAGRPLKLTRADFEELIGDLLRDIALFTAAVFARAPKEPQAVAVIGGGANIPAVLQTLERELDVPVLTVDDPEAVIAKGAALVADAAQPSGFPVAALGGDAPAGTFAKVVGTLAGAIVVVGLVIGYGFKTFAPTSDEEVSPAGTTSSALVPTAPVTVAPQTGAGTDTSGGRETVNRTTGVTPSVTEDAGPSSTRPGAVSTPSPTPTPTAAPIPSVQPTLRPDPNLPPIPFPELLGPLLNPPGGSSAPSQQQNREEYGPSTSPAPPPGVPPQTPAQTRIPFPPPPASAPPQAPAQTRIPYPMPRSNSGSARQGTVHALPLLELEFAPHD
ncbi:Hsp70 protein [Nocardia amikacinitolerans]|uniref:Hsp70 family protein n=1 Tax=Nocardia amikacinitolerans TaxID=756689 RepID=UPI0020A2A2D4|nr:Hsp70 family protein [Nocardia amikacinitolerans]MCP2295540.1 Hsp70 protein [Nocardia amikacinitolerans]